MNEAETRAEHTDHELKAASWPSSRAAKWCVNNPITPGRIEGHGKRGKALTADFVLAYRNRKLAEIKSGLRFRRPLRVLESFPDAYAGGGVGGVGGFFSRCGARSTWLALCHARSSPVGACICVHRCSSVVS